MADESSWFISNVVSNNKDQYLITLDETGDNYEAIPLKGTGKTYKLFTKIKNSEEGDSSWQKDSLIFMSSIIKTMKKQRF